MKKILAPLLFLLLIASNAHAQTTTTTTVSFGGTVNCQLIVLNLNRIQNGEIKTSLDFTVQECEQGYPIPTKVIASLYTPIPNGDFTVDKAGAHLLTQSPYGQMKIDWVITGESRSTYSAVWTTTAPTNTRQTQNNERQSVHATGTVGGWTIDRLGFFETSVVRK